MRFSSVVELHGKTATGFEVPTDIVTKLGAGKRAKVTVTIGSHTYRSSIATYDDRSMLPLSAENRNAAGVQAGEQIQVDVELDLAPREIAVPTDLDQALQDAGLRGDFDALSFSNRRRWIEGIEGAKQPATRERRVAKTIEAVREIS